MTEEENPVPLRMQIAELAGKKDDWWYCGMLDRSLCGRALSPEERDSVIHGCTEAAVCAYRLTVSRFEGQAPASIAKAIGLDVRCVGKDDLFGNEHILGLYDPKISTIMLCQNTVDSISRFISEQNLNDVLGLYNISDIALLHEIFHAVEDRTPEIYTRSRMLRRKLFYFFPVRVGLDAASEIGAIHFSKLMSRLPFSPCIYEWLSLVRNGRTIPDVWKV